MTDFAGFDCSSMSQRRRWAAIAWTPDLARNIGSFQWFAELSALIALVFSALLFWPSFSPLALPQISGGTEELSSLILAAHGWLAW
ncbi:MAG: hypothetical protein ABI673_04655 [Novosphingobium sp.]